MLTMVKHQSNDSGLLHGSPLAKMLLDLDIAPCYPHIWSVTWQFKEVDR